MCESLSSPIPGAQQIVNQEDHSMRESTLRRIVTEVVTKALKVNEIPELLTPAKVAEILNLEVQTLATWRHKGIGPKFRKIGGNVMYEKSALAESIANS